MNPISIVGAGPGALDLMTIRAQQRLKSADVLVWTDSLIPTQITKLAKDDCEKIKTSSLTLEEILLILIKRHKEGKRIVRLHDGDPCLYGAVSEQICRLNDEGIEVEVVPGVSAYQATAATLGFELTIPDLTQTIILSIADGDTVIVKKTSNVDSGQIAVVLIDDQEATLKRVRKKGNTIALEAANRNYGTKIYAANRIKIQGKLVSLYRNFH